MNDPNGNLTNAPVRWRLVLSAIVVTATLLTLLPGRASIAPVIESDYCHQLISVDRFASGQGLTSLQPVAPGQPWTWRYDFGFLTQWPAGYPLIISTVRKVLGCSTVDACRWVGLIACAAALVGWFAWMVRLMPKCLTGYLVSALAAGSAVTVGFLVDPSTDVLLIAALPFVLFATLYAVDQSAGTDCAKPRNVAWRFVLVGLISGALIWIRYAAVFVPLAIGIFLAIQLLRRRGVGFRQLVTYAVGAAIPIGALLLFNKTLASADSLQSQLNLGHQTGFGFSPSSIGQAWWNFTDLGYYNHHALSHWALAIGPLTVLLAAVVVAPIRRSVAGLFGAPEALLSVVVVSVLLATLIGVTALFGDKFDYIGLERYYRPVRPLYFLIAVCPFLLIRHRLLRASMVPILILACLWTVRQQWSKPYIRLANKEVEVTPYGMAATCFTPGASTLFNWLSERSSPDLILVSNFREVLALETGVAALPIPRDKEELDRWLHDVRQARGIDHPRVWFVLDPDNRWRSHWLPSLQEVVDTFDLSRQIQKPDGASAMVYEYRTLPAEQAVAARP